MLTDDQVQATLDFGIDTLVKFTYAAKDPKFNDGPVFKPPRVSWDKDREKKINLQGSPEFPRFLHQVEQVVLIPINRLDLKAWDKDVPQDKVRMYRAEINYLKEAAISKAIEEISELKALHPLNNPASYLTADRMVEFAQAAAILALDGGLNSAQMRKFYNQMKTVREENYPAFYFDTAKGKAPLLNYFAAKKEILHLLVRLVEPCLDKIDKTDLERGKRDYLRMVKFVEAILCYFVTFGGKEFGARD